MKVQYVFSLVQNRLLQKKEKNKIMLFKIKENQIKNMRSNK